MAKPSKCEESGCALARTGSGFTNVEIGSRYESTRLLIIGEASGDAESRESLPFRPYAQSGSLLADAMREVCISRAEVAITNILRCRPPKDWLEGAPWQYNAISHCTENYLRGVIHELRPNAILALGGTAYRTLTAAPRGKYGTLDYCRGYVVRGAGVAEGVPVIASYHPAYLRRGAAHLTPLLQRDLRRAFLLAVGRLVEGRHFILDPSQAGLDYETAPTIERAWDYVRGIDPDLPIAWDCETPRSTREDEEDRTSFTDRDIKLVQFTQRRGEGIAFPFRDEYIEVVRAILATPNDKITHNGWAFDDEVAEANGIEINGRRIDAMVAYGFYWSDLPKNLQAATQMAGFQFPWKHYNDIDEAFYGCADADATLCEYQYIRALLEREGLWESFLEYFAKLWPILRDMSARGIPIDNSRRLELKALIEREDERVTREIQAIVPAEVLATKQKNGYKNPPILKCENCDYEGRGDHPCTFEKAERNQDEDNVIRVVPYTELAEENGLVQRSIAVGVGEKCRCTKKSRSACAVCGGSGIIPAGVTEVRWAEPTAFNPNSRPQVIKFIKYLKHPVPKHSKRTDSITGEASETTEMKELERLWIKTKHPIYPLLIEKRQLTKVEGTYVEGWRPSIDGAVHTTYTFQTATWQTSSRSPNVQNGLKHGKTEFQKSLARGFNGMQRAKPNHVLINFDFKSFHALTTAHDFNIPDYARLARIDIHSFVTCYFLKRPEREKLWALSDQEMADYFAKEKKDELFKFCRDFKAKRAILGIQFGMGYRKLYQLNRDDFDSETEARTVWEMVYSLFPALRKAQDDVRRRAADEKRLVSKHGAIRHFFDVIRFDRKQQKWVPGDQAEEAVAFLPASHAFGHFRDALLKIRAGGFDARFGLCNQIHDSMLFHCPIDLAEECVSVVKPIMEERSQVLIYPSMAPDGLWVGVEAQYGDCLAECK